LGLAPYGLVTSDVAIITVNSPLAVAGPNDATVYDDVALVPFQITASGGVPPYTYSWRKDGVLLEDLVPAIPQPGAALLELTQPLQPGLYRCAVTDSDTPPTVRDSGQGKLTVYPHLAITAHPQSVGVNPGDDVTLDATVTGGIPPLIYTWRKDTAPLSPGEQPGGPELTLLSVDASDAGDYDLVVEDNGTDEVTSDLASVVVRGAPLAFVMQPAGVTRYVDEGDYTLEAAVAGGDGPVTLAWWFDDGLGGGPVSIGTGGSYIITSPTLADSGAYWCVATDDVGSIESDVAQVRFGDRITITQQPVGADRYVDEGNHVLEVAASGGLDALTFDWYLDLGTGALPVLVGSGPSYTVPAPPESSHGWYFCVVSDGVTEVQSDVAEVLFAQHMAFQSQPRGGDVRKGDSFTFSVVVTGGLRDLRYVWKRGLAQASLRDVPVPDPKLVETVGPDAPEYTIDVTELSDTGYYWVEVFDLEESIESDAAYLLVSAGIPVGGAFGLAALACALACAAAVATRRRK
ncbi:MAG TPA: immunoglobulin domain-containing protein, partial [Candidatus Hydrogenedentes bacterium]|nr:immunoglobulin domain-containing protein [Candidatus Hydrogenedentota bacterium]